MAAILRRVLAEPLLHFLALGAAMFWLYAALGDHAGAGPELVVSAGRIRGLAEAFTRRSNRPPSDDELAGLVRDYVRDEVLAREASALGLDRDDAVVRRRLAQKMEFLADEAPVAAPTDAELREFVAAHPDRFRAEARVSFDQVLLDRLARGDGLEPAAARLLAILEQPGAAPDPATLGDGRMLPAHYDDLTRGDVEAQFGASFAARLDELPEGRFVWPVESGYGPHLVRVVRRTPAFVPELTAIRDDVAREWDAAKRVDAKEARYQTLLARYRVTIEPAEPDRVAATER